MRVAITGGSGLVGRAVAAALRGRGDDVVPVSRDPSTPPSWSIDGGVDPPDALSGVDAVINVAGESIGAGRWTAARKGRIHDSRVLGTRRVVEALGRADPRPRTLINASAVGYYGDRGDELLDEHAGAGRGFLAELCEAWESEAHAAADLGVRVAVTRAGFVLARDAPALAKLARPFRFGLGARLGSGRQYFPWVHVDDLVAAFLLLLDHADLSGAFNVVAPTPCQNTELTRTLARVLRRPAAFVAPGFSLKLLLGEMAGPLALEGQRAIPQRLVEAGFDFRHDDLEAALRDVL